MEQSFKTHPSICHFSLATDFSCLDFFQFRNDLLNLTPPIQPHLWRQTISPTLATLRLHSAPGTKTSRLQLCSWVVVQRMLRCLSAFLIPFSLPPLSGTITNASHLRIIDCHITYRKLISLSQGPDKQNLKKQNNLFLRFKFVKRYF